MMRPSATSGVAYAVFLSTLVTLSAGFLVKDGKNLLMYFDETEIAIRSKDSKGVETATWAPVTGKSISYSVDAEPSAINVNLDYWPIADKITVFNLKLTFKQGRGGYWNMSDAVANIEGPKLLSQPMKDVALLQAIRIEAPNQRSFHCSNYGSLTPSFATKQGNHSIAISFKGLQVQAFQQKDAGSFSDSWDCVGFFSIGIWSGIFIVAMLIGILTWGMVMIMDVKTMDRFDDPKGKTISFGTGE